MANLMKYFSMEKLISSVLILTALWAFPLSLSAQETPAPAAETAAPATAEEEVPAITTETLAYTVDNLILFLAAVLVLFMQAGFAMVTAGLNAAKNTVNVLYKSVMDVSIGVLVFWLIGYGLMYPGADFAGGFFGFAGFGVPDGSGVVGDRATLHPQVDFLFQAAFAATAATIVAGAMAGRLKFYIYVIYSIVLTGFIYPISGMWKWGGGWLNTLGFHDFAGSILVHSVGGFAGLAGAIILGPRIGKFAPDGKPQVLAGHSLTMAALGAFILWIGWYGFNPGSNLHFTGDANIHAVMTIATNTTLAAVAGAVVTMIVTWTAYGKPELSMTLNGLLAGLVGITAGCDSVTNPEAMLIGGIAGILVVLGVKLLDKLKIDDPVGAFPVHGVNGIWGGIAVGIFGADKNLGAQLIGSLVVPLYAFAAMFVIFFVLHKLFNIRVSREEELKGLDVGEHKEEAYKGFQIFTID